jgi:N-acetylmuramoyl-L-alanine amidase
MNKFIKSKKLKALIAALALTFSMGQAAQAATYTVVEGESLFKIGAAFNTSSDALMKANNLSNEEIYPGQKLNIPSTTHTVKSGDTLFLLAKHYDVSIYSIRKVNNIWTDMILVGQKLEIPGATTGNTTVVRSATVTTAARQTVSPTASKAVIPYTSADLDLLARLIMSEAENQPYSAKVAVGAVVVNRVQDSRYPKTIKGVIYQVDAGYYQFSPVLFGTINKPANADSRRAAYEALHGADPTKGALYYFDDSTKNKWLWSKTIAVRIDRMVYTYYN